MEILNDSAIIDGLKKLKKDTETSWTVWKDDEYIQGRKFFDGVDQFSEDVKAELEGRGLMPLVINRTAPFIRQVNGLVQKATGGIKFHPLKGEDKEKYANNINQLAKWARNKKFDFANNKVIEDAAISGIGVLEVSLDHDGYEMHGMPSYKRIPPIEMMVDVDACAPNFIDAMRVVRAQIVSKATVAATFDIEESDIVGGIDDVFTQSPTSSGDGEIDDSYRDTGNVTDGRDRNDNVTLYDYQWCDYVAHYVVTGVTENQTLQAVAAMNDDYAATLDAFMERNELSQNDAYWLLDSKTYNELKDLVEGVIELKAVKKKVKKYFRAFIAGGTVLKKEPLKKGFTYVFYTMWYDEHRRCPYGYMRSLIAPQRISNSAFMHFYHSLLSSPKPTPVIEVDAVVDSVEDVERKVANNDGVIWARSGRGKDIGQMGGGNIPSGFEAPINIAKQGMHEATGLYLEMFGTQEMEMSGVLDMQRTEKGFDSMRDIIENYRMYLQSVGERELIMFAEMAEIMPNKTIDVTGADEESVELLTKEAYADVAVTTQEAPKDLSYKQENTKLMLEMLDRGIVTDAMQPLVIELLIENGEIPADIKARMMAIVKQMQEPPSQEELAAAQQEKQQEKEVTIALIQAEISKALAAAEESRANVELKAAQVEETLADAELKAAKTTETLVSAAIPQL